MNFVREHFALPTKFSNHFCRDFKSLLQPALLDHHLTLMSMQSRSGVALAEARLGWSETLGDDPDRKTNPRTAKDRRCARIAFPVCLECHIFFGARLVA